MYFNKVIIIGKIANASAAALAFAIESKCDNKVVKTIIKALAKEIRGSFPCEASRIYRWEHLPRISIRCP